MKNVLKTLAVFVLLAGTLIVAAPPTYIVAATDTIVPDGDGAVNAWAPSSGTDRYSRVNDGSTSTYITHDTPYVYTTFIFARIGSTNYELASISQGTSWGTVYRNSTTNPATSSAWTWDDVNNAQFGVAVATSASTYDYQFFTFDATSGTGDIDYLRFKTTHMRYYTGSTYVPRVAVFEIEVNYTIPIGAPEIESKAASSVAKTTARLNAQIADDGGEACEVRFGYGTTTQAAVDFADYDTLTAWSGAYTIGQNPYVDVSSLTADTTYYYRVQAKNSAGTVTSTDEITFDTLAGLNEPTNFNALPSATSVALSWVKGVGASTTLIRFSYTTYPTDETEGQELYSGAGSSYTHSGVASGTTIYYSAFGESGGSYSSSYATALATTLAGTGGELDFNDIEEPSNWFLDVDYTTQSGMFYYGTINDISDNLDMPRNTVWSLSALIIAMAGGFLVYVTRQSLLGGGAVMLIVMAISSAMWLIPGWILFVTLLILGGFGILHQRGGI